MASLVFIVPIAFFAFLGAVGVGLFGMALPALAKIPALAWVVAPWFVALLQIVLLILLFVMPLASILTWMERRQSAMMQDRLGPNRAAIPLPLIGDLKLAGIMHFVADALKMLFKEDFIPAKANKALFALGPILAIAPVFIVFAIVPWGPGIAWGHLGAPITEQELRAAIAAGEGIRLQAVHVEVGMLFYFAIASLAVYGATLAGWASYNKWSLLGGLRASSQMMSYEVTMGLAIMGTFLVTGSLEPSGIVDWQTDHMWGIVAQPLAFILFFTAAIAETKRTPFDIPEGESEIIGYFIEYSGMRFGMFFLAEFIEIVFVSAIVSTLFLGGYHLPFLAADGFHLFGRSLLLPHGLVVILQVATFGFKVYLLCSFQLMLRWTVPRLRPDQLMSLGWKGLLPLSILNLLITAGLVLAMGW
mgnify:CR=1 FL=1